MKIAISSTGESINDNIDEVFGRCPYFIIVDIEDGKVAKTEIVKNENADQPGGAGTGAAKLVAEKGANVVLAKNVGPRALDVLKRFDIETADSEGKISDAIQKFINKK